MLIMPDSVYEFHDDDQTETQAGEDEKIGRNVIEDWFRDQLTRYRVSEIRSFGRFAREAVEKTRGV